MKRPNKKTIILNQEISLNTLKSRMLNLIEVYERIKLYEEIRASCLSKCFREHSNWGNEKRKVEQ